MNKKYSTIMMIFFGISFVVSIYFYIQIKKDYSSNSSIKASNITTISVLCETHKQACMQCFESIANSKLKIKIDFRNTESEKYDITINQDGLLCQNNLINCNKLKQCLNRDTYDS